MRLKVQLVISADDDGTDTIHDVAVLEKDCQRLEQLGLTLAEAKQLLTRLQQHVVAHQATAFVTTRSHCQACGTPLQRKEQTTRVLRTLFGTVLLTNPRLYHCRCQTHPTTTFRPLTELLSASTTPELLFLETKWASLISYGMTARVLKDFLPLDETLNATTIQNHTLAVAQRCEGELEEEQDGVADSCPGDGGPLSLPKGPFSVGLDGGYVRDWEQKQRHFEVIVGQSAGQMLWLRPGLRYQIQTPAGRGVAVTRRAGLATADVFVRWRRDGTKPSLAASLTVGASARLGSPYHARDRLGAVHQRLDPFGSSSGGGYSEKAEQCEVAVMAWQSRQRLGPTRGP